MKYRTDLAVEIHENLKNAEDQSNENLGFTRKQRDIDEDIALTEIIITDETGERAFGKPKGTYITLEVKGIAEEKENIKQRAARALAAALKELISFHYHLKVLVVGLGNEKVTPDSLGPHTVDKVKVTSHLFRIYDCDGDWDMANVSGFNPSVTGVTGMETADVIEKIVGLVEPEVVVIIDALAAKDIRRISSTIQICDTGIAPGAGMGNRRKEISHKTLGCKVISIGVPTVIDSRTLILDAASEMDGWSEKAVTKYFAERDLDMIVTSTDIDQIIKDFSEIIADGINITLHPGIYS
ncbi:MAG: GPR endopeptidase [Firmicutes bacterium]|jgi:spore protease|nr:GPR endopeptidase [Bacillota bacterium]